MVAQIPCHCLGRVQSERYQDRVRDDRQAEVTPPGPAMIDHASIGVRDMAAAAAFYEPVLATIGLRRLVVHPTTLCFGKTYPPGFPVCQLLTADHAPVRRMRQSSDSLGRPVKLPTAAI